MINLHSCYTYYIRYIACLGAGLPFDGRAQRGSWRHRISFYICCSLPFPNSSVNAVQMKSSMKFIQSDSPYENEKWAAHGQPTEAVGSSVDRSCPLFM